MLSFKKYCKYISTLLSGKISVAFLLFCSNFNFIADLISVSPVVTLFIHHVAKSVSCFPGHSCFSFLFNLVAYL